MNFSPKLSFAFSFYMYYIQIDSKVAENEPPRDKTNKMICAPNEDSDHPGHPPSLIRVFAVRSMGS